MLIIENVCLSDDVAEEHFICDLLACKGACCVEGDSGAPLEPSEIGIIEKILDKVLHFVPDANKDYIRNNGWHYKDSEGDICTQTMAGKECVFAVCSESGVWKCSFELAFEQKLTNFQKPISCHLYPIRSTTTSHFVLLNYHRWDVCSPACVVGKSAKVPVFKFLEKPLRRKFGNEWFEKLEDTILSISPKS